MARCGERHLRLRRTIRRSRRVANTDAVSSESFLSINPAFGNALEAKDERSNGFTQGTAWSNGVVAGGPSASSERSSYSWSYGDVAHHHRTKRTVQESI